MQLLANGKQQFLDQSGAPLAGGLVYHYAPGTTSPVTTYKDSAGQSANTNPIQLDSRGQAVIWGVGTFRQVVTDAVGTLIWDQTVSAPDVAAQIGGAGGAASVGFVQLGAGAVTRTLQDKGRETLTLADFDSATHAVVAAAGKRLLIAASESVTLNVPSAFPTIAAAWSALAGWIIHGTATIKIADGSYTIGASISLNHPFGSQIQIVGNAAAPDNVILMGPNPPTFDMFVISSGHQIGMIQGVHASLSAKAAQANNATAFLSLNGASMTIDSCKANNWYYAFAARNGGVMKLTNSTADAAGDVGVWAFAGANIQCSNVQSNNASDTANGLGFGFQAEFGGVVEAQNCSATGCNVAGFATLSNGTGRYYNCTANANTGSGFMSRGGGQVEANGSSSTGNHRYGIEITEYGNIIGLPTNSGNTLGAASVFPYFDTSTGNARLAASSGQLRLDTNDASSVYFNTPGGLQAEVRHMPAAVNHPVLQGGATGGAAALLADGSDAVVDLALLPKGTGSYVRFGAGYFTPAPVPNGFFSVRLNDGSLVQVPCFK